MPLANLMLILLIGLIWGVIASVALKSHGLVFVVNIVLGILGSAIGALAPVLFGSSLGIDVSGSSYLLRALLGAFAIVLVASLFRPVKLRGTH